MQICTQAGANITGQAEKQFTLYILTMYILDAVECDIVILDFVSQQMFYVVYT